MARSQPARGRGGGGQRSGDGKAAPAPTAQRQRRTPAPSPRPTPPGRRKPDKAGSVTKGVQQGRGSRFISEVIAELKKVSWPTRDQLLQSTAVVLAVVVIVALYLWAVDSVFERLVDAVF